MNPDNIFLTRCDMGAAFKLSGFSRSQASSLRTRLTRPVAATAYSPPELSEKIYSFEIDAWALGVVLYESLTGFVPLREPGKLSVCCLYFQDYEAELAMLIATCGWSA